MRAEVEAPPPAGR